MANAFSSQVTSVIASLFPHVCNESAPPQTIQLPILRMDGILSLVNQISPQLITVQPDEYTRYVRAVSVISYMRDHAISRGEGNSVVGELVDGRDVATVIYSVLKKCPDELPPKGVDELMFIVDADRRNNIKSDIGSSFQSFWNSEWKAAKFWVEQLLRRFYIGMSNNSAISDEVKQRSVGSTRLF